MSKTIKKLDVSPGKLLVITNRLTGYAPLLLWKENPQTYKDGMATFSPAVRASKGDILEVVAVHGSPKVSRDVEK